MSLLGSLNTAVSGLNAQSTALGSISDNIANSQTVGFKGTHTAFVSYLTDSSPISHAPGAVVARPQYTNSVQGAVTQVSNPTALAISGNGMFAVQRPPSPQQFYTRVGDFAPNSAGFLVNSTGYSLDGWPATNAAGTQFDPNAIGPIQISKAPSVPVKTANVSLAANLPSNPPPEVISYTNTVQIHDAGGSPKKLTLLWEPVQPNQWNLTVSSEGSTLGKTEQLVEFGAKPETAGTITSITSIPPVVPAPTETPATGTPATVSVPLNYGLGLQTVVLNLGEFGKPNGVTQFTGNDYQVTSQSQDGVAQGNFASVTIQPTGNVVINYDNGYNATIARIPLVSFNNPDALQQQDGQAFTGTVDSGIANIVSAGVGGTGKLVVGAEEASNVDIASQFTQMIVAQRAYTANTKVVTTANQLLQDVLNMV